MRFTERELTVALEGAAKTVLAAQDKTVRKGRRTADEAWEALTKYQRFQLLDGLGDQLLPVLVGAAGRRGGGRGPGRRSPTRRCARRSRSGSATCAGIKRQGAAPGPGRAGPDRAGGVPPRADPDALIVPDHL